MASPVVPDSLAAVQSSAAQSFATALADFESNGGTTAPSPETPAAPVIEAAPTPDVSATPVQGAVDTSAWSPEAKRALSMEGWDGKSAVTPDLLQRVATRHLEFNNRLAAIAKGKVVPDAPAVSAPVVPVVEQAPVVETKPQEVKPEPAAPPADLDLTQVEAKVNQELERNPAVSNMVETWSRNERRLGELVGTETTIGQIQQTQRDLYYEKRRLESPEVKGDVVLFDEAARRVQLGELLLERLQTERERLSFSQETLAQRYANASNEARSRLTGQIQQQSALNRRTQELATAWPGTIERVFEANKVPPSNRAAMSKIVRDAFVAQVNIGGVVPDMATFFDAVVKETLKSHEDYHRGMMATYGAQAHQRTDIVTPPPTNGAPPASATEQDQGEPKSLADLYRRTDKDRVRAFRA